MEPTPTLNHFYKMLEIYATPSESLWRALEIDKVLELAQALRLERPILEIGCGSGAFSSIVFEAIDDAVDINPKAVERARTSTVFRRVHCMDARAMSFGTASYGTVFANCVLEHIPDLASILKDCARVLRPGGRLLATVPLRAMNEHLLFSNQSYAAHRQASLVHVNLLAPNEWRDLCITSGFDKVDFHPYFYGGHCHLWDSIDAPLSIGIGRYRLGAALSVLTQLLPPHIQQRLRQATAAWLAVRSRLVEVGPACAAALVATKA